jgi:hypothetical protein
MIRRPALLLMFGAVLCVASKPAAQAQTNLLEQLRRPQEQPSASPVPAPPALDTLKRPVAPGKSSAQGPQVRAVTAHGPDLLGVRLGMPMVEAEALIRRTINITRVLDTPDPSSAQASPLALRLQGRLFMTDDGKDQVALFQGREATADHVLGVWRKTNVGSDSWEKTLAALVLRHGPIATRSAMEAYWGAPSSNNALCQGGSPAEWPVWRERDKSVPLNQSSGYIQLVPALPLPNPRTLSGYEPCDALLAARYDGSARDDSRSSSVITRLFDMGVLAWLVSRPPPALSAQTPGQLMVAGPHGPDILGIRLGMTIEDAEALIRDHMQVGRVFELSPPSSAPDHMFLVPYLRALLFVSEDQDEYIALFEAPAYAPGRVIRAARGLYPTLKWDQALASLAEKYGPPDRVDNGTFPHAIWGGLTTSCDVNIVERIGTYWAHWQENGQPLPERGPEQRIIGDVNTVEPPYLWQNKREDYSSCGPTIRVDYGNSAARTRAILLTTRLFDQSFMAWLLAQPKPAAPRATPMPNVKF